MAITADSLRWFQSERMTDEDDGGGQMSGHEIVPGIENQVFDDLSDVNRAAGDVSIRKVYAAVGSHDADKYLDAGVVVFRHPPGTRTCRSRSSAPGITTMSGSKPRNYFECLRITRGERLSAWLWGDHFAGQRVITIWQRFTEQPPANGSRLDLVAMVSNKATHNQILWVTSVTVDDEQRVDNNGWSGCGRSSWSWPKPYGTTSSAWTRRGPTFTTRQRRSSGPDTTPRLSSCAASGHWSPTRRQGITPSR